MFVPTALTSCSYALYFYLRNVQAFTNCVHGYDHMHANIIHTQKFACAIDSSLQR